MTGGRYTVGSRRELARMWTSGSGGGGGGDSSGTGGGGKGSGGVGDRGQGVGSCAGTEWRW